MSLAEAGDMPPSHRVLQGGDDLAVLLAALGPGLTSGCHPPSHCDWRGASHGEASAVLPRQAPKAAWWSGWAGSVVAGEATGSQVT